MSKLSDGIKFGLGCVGKAEIYGFWSKGLVIHVTGEQPLQVTGCGDIDADADVIFEQPETGIKMYLRWYDASKVKGAADSPAGEGFCDGGFAPVVSPFGGSDGLEDNIDAADLIAFDDLSG